MNDEEKYEYRRIFIDDDNDNIGSGFCHYLNSLKNQGWEIVNKEVLINKDDKSFSSNSDLFKESCYDKANEYLIRRKKTFNKKLINEYQVQDDIKTFREDYTYHLNYLKDKEYKKRIERKENLRIIDSWIKECTSNTTNQDEEEIREFRRFRAFLHRRNNYI